MKLDLMPEELLKQLEDRRNEDDVYDLVAEIRRLNAEISARENQEPSFESQPKHRFPCTIKSRRRRFGEWYVRVWVEGDERNGTTWPIPAGNFWATLKEKLTTGSHHPDAVTLTGSDFVALRSIVHAYGQVIDQPRWKLDELVEAMADAEKEESPW